MIRNRINLHSHKVMGLGPGGIAMKVMIRNGSWNNEKPSIRFTLASVRE